jgi:hypothetical protein
MGTQIQTRPFKIGDKIKADYPDGSYPATVSLIREDGQIEYEFVTPNEYGACDTARPGDLRLALEPPIEHPAMDYIKTVFRADDRVCIFLLPSDGKNIDFRRADHIATPDYMQRLVDKNAAGFNVFVCMNALLPDAKSRTKSDIGSIRTVYLDFDDDGQSKVDKVMSSTLVPKPTFILESSPSKFQVIWSIREEITIQQQEALLVALISNFGGDKACKDATRVLRLPGFANRKYPEGPVVKVVYKSATGPVALSDFQIKDISESKVRTSPSLIGDKIPHGQHDTELTRIAGKLRADGMEEENIGVALIEVVEKRCEGYGNDYVEMCRKIAKSICRYQPGSSPKVLLNGKEVGEGSVGATGTAFSSMNISLSYSDEIFHGLAGRIIKKLQPETESHPVGNLLELLAAYGNIIGPNPHYIIEDTKHFANLFVVKVGKSSKSRKGTGKARIERVVSGLDLSWFTSRNTSGMGSGEGVVWEVRDRVFGPVKDKHTGAIRFEVTDPGIDDKRLFISEGEFVGVLAVAGRKDSLLSKIIRDAWDHKPLRNKTKGSSVVCQDPHISISADITREELYIQLKEGDKFNGFGNRFLWCFVERQGLKPHGGEEIDWSTETRELYDAVEFARKQKRIFMDRNARLMWERMYGELSEDIPGLVGAVTSRGEAQTIRLALIFAMLDLSDHIGTEHLKAARALWQYLEDSARVIFGGVTKDHQRILDFLQQGPQSISDIRTTLYSKNRKKEDIQTEVTTLVSLGRIVSVIGDDGIERLRLP